MSNAQKSAFRFRLEPTEEQIVQFARFAGSTRFVFNQALALQKELQQAGEKRLNYSELCKQLIDWKKEFNWLSATPSQALQQSLKDLTTAFTNAWRRVKQNQPVCFSKIFKGQTREATFEEKFGFPVFKKKGKRDSFRFPDPKHLQVVLKSMRRKLNELSIRSIFLDKINEGGH